MSGAAMRYAGIMVLLAGACAAEQPSQRATSRPTSPSEPSQHRLVGEGETGPSRTELRPYMHQRPLVLVLGTRDLVVFADGVAFLEEERSALLKEDPDPAADRRFRRMILKADRLDLLRGELKKGCPPLGLSQSWCSHSRQTSVTCNLDGIEFVGTDRCEGRGDGQHVFRFAKEIVDSIATGDLPPDNSAVQDWFSGTDIERMLTPIHWKKYAPPAGD